MRAKSFGDKPVASWKPRANRWRLIPQCVATSSIDMRPRRAVSSHSADRSILQRCASGAAGQHGVGEPREGVRKRALTHDVSQALHVVRPATDRPRHDLVHQLRRRHAEDVLGENGGKHGADGAHVASAPQQLRSGEGTERREQRHE